MNKKVEEAINEIYAELNDSAKWNERVSIIKQHILNLEENNDELRIESNITLHTLINKKEGTITVSSERYHEKELEIIKGYKLQSKLDKIEDVVNNVFKEYTQSNGKYSFSGNDLLEIKSILDKEEETKWMKPTIKKL